MSEETRRRHGIIAYWLFVMCAMVFVMVVLGGLTRLTQSGLSMVEWKPLTGWLPPTSEEEWLRTFEAYQRYPQFMKVFPDMDLAGFKGIFWLEFIHRVWGRVMGVVFLAPFLLMVARGWVDRVLGGQLALMFVLGGLQGVLGWLMVKSGMVDRPDVSQYRLTAHLGLALVVYGYMFWVALGLLFPREEGDRAKTVMGLGRHAGALVALVFLTILSGGFVAGLDAGFTYNTFPLMDGSFVPSGAYEFEPAWASVFEDIPTVQFNHRILAETTLLLVALFWIKARRMALPTRARWAVNLLGLTVLLQVSLGIATLLLVVPVPVASAHQAGAVLLLTAALWVAFETNHERRGHGDGRG